MSLQTLSHAWSTEWRNICHFCTWQLGDRDGLEGTRAIRLCTSGNVHPRPIQDIYSPNCWVWEWERGDFFYQWQLQATRGWSDEVLCKGTSTEKQLYAYCRLCGGSTENEIHLYTQNERAGLPNLTTRSRIIYVRGLCSCSASQSPDAVCVACKRCKFFSQVLWSTKKQMTLKLSFAGLQVATLIGYIELIYTFLIFKISEDSGRDFSINSHVVHILSFWFGLVFFLTYTLNYY